MDQSNQNPALAKFLDELGIGDELEPIAAYVLGFCTSSKSMDLEGLTARVIALLVEAHPEVGTSLRAPKFPELLQSLWGTALKIRDAGAAHDFGLGLDSELRSESQVVAAGEGLSSCLYCFLRGLKDGVGSRPVLLDSFTLKQLNELEGAWDLLANLARQVKKYRGQEYRLELKGAIRSCRTLWNATFPGLVQSLR